MRHQTILLTISAFALSTVTATASATEPNLKEIMQELRSNLIEITDGLLVADFDRIERGAIGIAEHPPIAPSQVKLVLKALGPEMPKFKGFDVQVHKLALSIAVAAKTKNGNAILADYQQMLSGCLGCHTTFKDRVSKALN